MGLENGWFNKIYYFYFASLDNFLSAHLIQIQFKVGLYGMYKLTKVFLW